MRFKRKKYGKRDSSGRINRDVNKCKNCHGTNLVLAEMFLLESWFCLDCGEWRSIQKNGK